VGATTLVDFGAGGVGGEFLHSVGMTPIEGEALPGYVAWLPDRTVTLHRDPAAWSRERLKALGDTARHRSFWSLLDRLAEVFWRASRRGVKLPIRNIGDIIRAVRSVGPAGLPLTRYVRWTVADALRAHRLSDDRPLVSLLGMLVQDTVQGTVAEAPLINAALGITIRGAGLTRPSGGMRGFWKALVARYRGLGGELRVGCPVERIDGYGGAYRVVARRGEITARQVVTALPVAIAARLGPAPVAERLAPYIRRDEAAQGGAAVVFLGVPEDEVAGQTFTHHQMLYDYALPLNNGNNMFVSVSAAGDTESAPTGHRAVMISTHCELNDWEGLTPETYAARKRELGERLITLARRVYPILGRRAVVCEVATPSTYERFTGRPRGAVGGIRQSLANSKQNAVPHDIGIPGYWLAGDGTWPGLGTVACCLGSRLVAGGVLRARMETS
jgi:phytoene dehydrogenase-like protein